MKNNRFFSGILLSSCIAASTLFVLPACDKDDDDDNVPNERFELSGSATGAQEVPAVTTNGTGTISGSYDKNTNTLSYDINWTGISGDATVAHFHGPADPGVSAGPLVDIPITTNGVNGRANGTVVIHDSVETALLSGKVYYNIHTATFPEGEIRGQVLTARQ